MSLTLFLSLPLQELFVAKLAQESLVVALETHSTHEVTYKHLGRWCHVLVGVFMTSSHLSVANAVRKHPKTMKFLFGESSKDHDIQ